MSDGQGTLEDKKKGLLFRGEMKNNAPWNGVGTYEKYGYIIRRKNIVNGVAKSGSFGKGLSDVSISLYGCQSSNSAIMALNEL